MMIIKLISNLIKIYICFVIIMNIYSSFAQNRELITHFENSDFKQTPIYDSTVSFCKKLDKYSKFIKYQSFGFSEQNRELPLLIFDLNGNFTPQKVKQSGNLVVLIQSCIHAGEPDGKDAVLMLLRDYIVKNIKYESIKNITILFIPILNVDGHERFGKFNRINQNGPEEMGWRTNANNLNLNRDYLKADSKEIRYWLKLFNTWEPDFFIDCHTTDGADYQYVITYAIETEGNCDTNLSNWLKNNYLKKLDSIMFENRTPIFPYVTFRNWHDPRSGLKSGTSPTMLSQGYTIARNRPGLLIETHMLKDYKTRVFATHTMIENTLKILNNNFIELKKNIKEADLNSEKINSSNIYFPINFKVSMNDSVIVDFLGVEYKIEKSKYTNGDWFKYNSEEKKTFKIPFFNKIITETYAEVPFAYIIGPEWNDIIEKIKYHGIKYKTISKPLKISVKTYKFSNVKFNDFPYEGRQTILKFDLDTITEFRTYPKGSLIIETNQKLSKLILNIFEPNAQGSYVYWGFFNTIFEQKEYAESYVIESMIEKIFSENPTIKEDFNAKISYDSNFSGNERAIINWLYSKTPYWDNCINVYPVGKIFDHNVLIDI